VSFPVLDRRELVAGKVKALMERTASRDLYDLARMAASNPNAMDDPLLRALVIRAISTADPFPAVQDPVEALSRFAEPTVELVESLRRGRRRRRAGLPGHVRSRGCLSGAVLCAHRPRARVLPPARRGVKRPASAPAVSLARRARARADRPRHAVEGQQSEEALDWGAQ